jgi:RimJ/RimL family protein N-acetyltransferase
MGLWRVACSSVGELSHRCGWVRIMSNETSTSDRSAWRLALPVLPGQTVTLREPAHSDLVPLLQVLSTAEVPQFGLDDDLSEAAVMRFIDSALQDRARGLAFTYVVTIGTGRHLVGLIQVRGLDPMFESAEWDALVVPSVRGTSVFIEAARLAGSFVFGTLGTHRLESRVLLHNGRANGALRKLGASQEGLLRRSVRRHDQYFDQVLWSVLRDDWASQWLPTGPRVH